MGVSCGECSGIESVKLKGGEVRKAVGGQGSSSLMAGGGRWASKGFERVISRKGGSSSAPPQTSFLATLPLNSRRFDPHCPTPPPVHDA